MGRVRPEAAILILLLVTPHVSAWGLGDLVGAVAVGAGAVVAAPFVLGAAGFTGAGIAAGSAAASMMSSVAIANGGGIAAGSMVAVMQSAGAAGLGAAGKAAVGTIAGGVYHLATSDEC